MITPLEIENKEFSRTMRGYSAEEVDDFLDRIILDLEVLMKENADLKRTVEELNHDISQFKRSETSVMNTLESAKKLMRDISESAEKRAEIIVKNAQLDAEVIQRDAKESISKLTEEGQKLRNKIVRFRVRYKQILEDEMSQLDGSSEELLAELEGEFLPASMDQAIEDKEAMTGQSAVEEAAAEEAPFRTAPEKKSRVTDETIVIKDRSIDEILRDDFGFGDNQTEKKEKALVKEDLTKTRII